MSARSTGLKPAVNEKDILGKAFPNLIASFSGTSVALTGLGCTYMQSTQKKVFDKPLDVTDRREEDLQSLLNEFRKSNVINLNSVHGRGAVLFAEGEPVRGAYILRTGRATVSISSSEGRVVMLGIAQPGDVLGLNSALRKRTYETTVKTLELCRTDFIPQAQLIDLIEQSEAGARAILKILSRELRDMTDRAKLVLLPQTVSGRLARLLLEWSKEHDSGTSHPVQLNKVLTHEQVAQMICSSRETVTRLLSTFSRQGVICITSDSILIRDRLAMERLAQS
jgi:CRP/FNR family transcriptional regulator